MSREKMTSNNMYRVGDFVFFEASASAPFQIRKIEELNKTSSGAVEAKVVCFYRRQDLASSLVQLADAHQRKFSQYFFSMPVLFFSNLEELLKNLKEHASPEQVHQLKHRELFLSRHLEVLPATHIRGKCHVTLRSETEPCMSYLQKDDAFFFQLVYDPVNKTLQADRGAIRIGDNYQAVVPERICQSRSSSPPPPPPSSKEKQGETGKGGETGLSREELLWSPTDSLTSAEVDAYILMAKALATLAHAYYPPSALRQPTLTASAAAASRDATVQQAMDTLFLAGHDVARALQLLAPSGVPAIRLDEMEEWSISEGNLFEEALEKYGKCFYDIHSDFLPWKSPKSLVAFYYMWKTTDHYVQQKRMKAVEAEHRLKQVYIPNYNKPNPAVLYTPPKGDGTTPQAEDSAGCDSCGSLSTSQWYALRPAATLLKVCAACWAYWKHYGDFKVPALSDKLGAPVLVYRCPVRSCEYEFEEKAQLAIHLDIKHPQYGSACAAAVQPTWPSSNHIVTAAVSSTTMPSPLEHLRTSVCTPTSGSPSSRSAAAAEKARTGFYLHSSLALRFARRLCASELTLRPRRQARQPFTESQLTLAALYTSSRSRLQHLSPALATSLSKTCRSGSVFSAGGCVDQRKLATLRVHSLTDALKRRKQAGKVASPPSSPSTTVAVSSPTATRSSSETSMASNSVSQPTSATGKRPAPSSSSSSDKTTPIAEPAAKKSRCTDSPIQFNVSPSHPSPLRDATRETGFGDGIPRAETLMFLAATSLRYVG
uniref:Metastasis-associated protein MTA3 n=1 Tax=Schistocephalus solidus TaxID=70667 RepID=A0A0X3PQZ4_SCHSO